MTNVKEIKIKVDVLKVISLRDVSILDNTEANELLKQFSKEDLINALLEEKDEYEDQDEEEDEEQDEEQEEVIIPKENNVKRNKSIEVKEDEDEDDEVLEEGNSDNDLDELDLS